MFILKTLSAAAILTLSIGCQTTGSTAPGGGSKWMAHEDISRTYRAPCKVHEHASGMFSAHEDTSRTFDACCPMVEDAPDLRQVGDDTSRTYHSACTAVADETRGEGASVLGAKSKCEVPGEGTVCVNCTRN